MPRVIEPTVAVATDVAQPVAPTTFTSRAWSSLLALTSSSRYEFWDENIRLSTVIPGSVATPIWGQMGGAPLPFAISPEESARGILKGLAANEKIIVVTDPDRDGAENFSRAIVDPEFSHKSDEWFANNARERRSGKVAV